MNQPLLCGWNVYPGEPLDLPADKTYALINDGFIPIELHGDPGNDFACHGRVVGFLSPRRSNGGKVIFTTYYKDPSYEQMIAEILAGHEMNIIILGGSWAYKACIGISGWHVKTRDLGMGGMKPAVITMLSDEVEKAAVKHLNAFVEQFKKTTKGIYVLRYVDLSEPGSKVVARAQIALGARRIVDLDKLHLRVIRQSQVISKAVKGAKGDVSWIRDDLHRQLTITFEGTPTYIMRAIESMSVV